MTKVIESITSFLGMSLVERLYGALQAVRTSACTMGWYVPPLIPCTEFHGVKNGHVPLKIRNTFFSPEDPDDQGQFGTSL